MTHGSSLGALVGSHPARSPADVSATSPSSLEASVDPSSAAPSPSGQLCCDPQSSPGKGAHAFVTHPATAQEIAIAMAAWIGAPDAGSSALPFLRAGNFFEQITDHAELFDKVPREVRRTDRRAQKLGRVIGKREPDRPVGFSPNRNPFSTFVSVFVDFDMSDTTQQYAIVNALRGRTWLASCRRSQWRSNYV
jgi:hypothetical protein